MTCCVHFNIYGVTLTSNMWFLNEKLLNQRGENEFEEVGWVVEINK